jgi:hypothetical protein
MITILIADVIRRSEMSIEAGRAIAAAGPRE